MSRVKDFMLDMQERDLLFEDKSNAALPIFDSLWGNLFSHDEAENVLICNIIIPEAYWGSIKFEDGELILRFASAYVPDTRHFRIRPVKLCDGQYALFNNVRNSLGYAVSSYATSKNVASPLIASMLPFVDVDGEFEARITQSKTSELFDRAYLYSAKQTDINVGLSDNQASQLLSLCAPGMSYRYPTTGVGITKYLNRVVAHSGLEEILETQFNGDGKPLQSATFDNETCKLDVLFTPEQVVEDAGLDSVDDLDISLFSLSTDEFIKRNTVLSEVSDAGFMDTLDSYSNLLGLFLFLDYGTASMRIADSVAAGRFDEEGNIVASNEYFVVSATLEANTVAMFDDEGEDDIKDAPVFIVNGSDETRLYTALVEQPYWVTATCHKCFILKHRATVKYVIRQDDFRAGRGLHSVPQTSANIKNMLGLVQDVNTGRLLGIVSQNTNISDVTLDEITQHIYATQIIA